MLILMYVHSAFQFMKGNNMKTDFSAFEKELGYVFTDKSVLEKAFTHTTYTFEHHKQHYESNQRLEFIGDSVLDIVIGRALYDLKQEEGEGYLSKTRSIIVCEPSLARAARRLHMGDYLMLGKGEDATGGRDKDSTLSDTFESVIAAVYFDGGFEEAERIALLHLDDSINEAIEGRLVRDYKSRLMEIAQKRNNQHEVKFTVIGETGPAHMREFEVECTADGQHLATAKGRSKKAAEQICAKEAIEVYERLFEN